MKKPVLVIMAAGMGSRYGGLKQIDPIDEEGHIIMDFSIYDAKRAGFEKVIFIINEENESDFRTCIGNRISEYVDVSYVFQKLDNIPEGFTVPEGRVKPFGTGHAILSCKGVVEGPFAVINADDYYGVHALQEIYTYLSEHEDDRVYRYAMVGYRLNNTLTDNGYVSRGICETDQNEFLTGITERTHIERRENGVAFTEDDGKTWNHIEEDTIVSLNMFGFTNSMLVELGKRFPAFLEKNLPISPMKCEYFLPTVVGDLLAEKAATVKVLKSEDKWYGVTYKEDRQSVVDAVSKMKAQGVYPTHLWD